MIIVAYSCGRWCRSIWAAMLGAAVVFVAAAGATVWANPAERAEDLAYPIVYLAAAVAAGLVVRRQVVQTAELARLNADLAAQVDVAAQLAAVTERMRLARDPVLRHRLFRRRFAHLRRVPPQQPPPARPSP